MQLTVKTPLAMRKLGSIISDVCLPGTVIYLHGDLGTGKTTFTRGFLRGLGYRGRVKSPTFNLFESYQIKSHDICHFDFYRLIDPEELVYIGISDYFNDKNICLIEWSEKGEGQIAKPDLCCSFDFAIKGQGRLVRLESYSFKGRSIISEINFDVLQDEKLL